MSSTEQTQNQGPREIKLSELKDFVNEGKKREDLQEIYGINNAQVTKLMQQAGLTFRKFRKPSFVLVDDIAKDVVAEVNPSVLYPETTGNSSPEPTSPVTETEVAQASANNNWEI